MPETSPADTLNTRTISAVLAADTRSQARAGIHLDFGFFDTPIGVVLLAATAQGLSCLRLCEFHGAQAQMDGMMQDYARAECVENPASLQPCADALIAFLEARAASFSPPLDILLGTAFQREVWATLQTIAPGETVTYSQLATRMGRPNAVRAVASACASNQLAIALPCHRVVGANGSLSGYRWGLAWKQRLLELEAQMSFLPRT